MKYLIILAMSLFSFVFSQEICGNITEDTTYGADTDWLLTCQTFVQSGVTVTFEAGTTVKALSDDGTGLAPAFVFTQGSMIMAEGTADAPITFTSNKSAEELALNPRGQWGGLIILGSAPIANAGGVAFVEGVIGQPYGGNDADDNSGIMRYVRVWHGGRSIGQDNEINGITLAGVGRGTTVDYCEVAYNLDDGFEMFGGTVDLTNCSVVNVGDDAFDTDNGYQGRGQFLFVHRDADSDKAHEMDSATGGDLDSQPRSHPAFSNVTVMGGSSAGNTEDGLRLREGTGGDFRNYIIMDVADDAIRNDDNGSELVTQELGAGTYPDYLYISPNTLMWNIGDQNFDDFDDSGDTWTAITSDPGLTATDDIDVTPAAGGPAYSDVDQVSAWHTQTDYKGAFGAVNWLAGWSILSDSFINEDQCLYDGDVTSDGVLNVVDVVAVVSVVVGQSSLTDDILCSADLNQDGIINVVDIVGMVNFIINSVARADDASEATITIAGNLLSVEGNGFIQGAQLTLTHDSSINIDLANEFVADYRTNGNTTTLVVVTDGSRSLTDIATISGDYQIVESLVVGSGTEILTDQIVEVSAFELKAAYPNPFNPTTSLDLVVPEAGYVSVKVYNLMGQEVATLVEGMMQQTSGYTMTWNASNMASGVYIVRAEGAGSVATQKLMLLK